MASEHSHHHHREHGVAEKAKDPVCGMNVSREQPRGGTFEYQSETYYFCNPKCRERFSADPEKYLHPAPSTASSEAVAATSKTSKASEAASRQLTGGASPIYVCPMDPEVRETKPGACPKCGMALEPEQPIAAARTEWVCPMHPEVVKSEPGSCPICGMALEPRTATVESDNPELRDMSRRFWVAVALSAPLLALVMGDMALDHAISHRL